MTIRPRRRNVVPGMKATRAAMVTEQGPGFTAWLLVAVLCVVQFIDVLGTTFLIVALPSVQGELGLSSGAMDLLAGIFALCFGALLILGGKLADQFGSRRMVLAGLGLFLVASLTGGLAPHALLVFTGRAAQGVAAALAVPAALAILTGLFRDEATRNRALGVWTAAGAAGGAAGFAAGGVVTELLGWRWTFLLNAPIALAALVIVLRLAPVSAPAAERQVLNLRGAVLLTGGLLAWLLGLSRLRNSAGTFDLVMNLVLLLGGVVLLAAFVVVERSSAEPLIPGRLLRMRSVVGSALVAFGLTFTTTAASVILTLFLQRVLEVEPSRSGLLLSPVSVAVVAGSAGGARLVSGRGFGLPMGFGLLAIAIAMVLFGLGMGQGSVPWIITGLVASGVGLGCASVASTACGLSKIGQADKGTAAGLITSAAMLGTAAGITSLGAIAAWRTSWVATGVEPSPPALTAGYQLAIIVAGAVALALMPVAFWSARATSKTS